MSKFLGPIHYWLYHKIELQENLTKMIAEDAVSKCWISKEDYQELVKEYLPALEDVINVDNIHGWLQGCINDAETRYARLISMLLTADGNRLEEIKNTAHDFGSKNKIENCEDLTAVFKKVSDTLLAGMPCDRILAVTDNTERTLDWIQTRDIHAAYWNSISSDIYYEIQFAMLEGMLEETDIRIVYQGERKYQLINNK